MTTQDSGLIGELLANIRQYTEGRGALLAGVIAGLAGLLLSYGLKGANLGRPLGDPMPLMLAVTQVTGGFIYFPWRPALYHLAFAVLLGVIGNLALWLIGKGMLTSSQATQAGRIAALINVLIVAVLAVDAVVVGFWYLVSGLASVFISGLAAGLTYSTYAMWQKRRGR
jgi:hypothetical protein